MKKIFNSVSTTATESYYLETNTISLRFIIIARRLMFYWNILQKPENELVKQVLRAQQLSPVKNDFCLEIEENLKYCNINLSEDEISTMKKRKFKNLVNTNINEVARSYLIGLKEKHSKSSGLNISNNMQGYLTSPKINVQIKQFLFKL